MGCPDPSALARCGRTVGVSARDWGAGAPSLGPKAGVLVSQLGGRPRPGGVVEARFASMPRLAVLGPSEFQAFKTSGVLELNGLNSYSFSTSPAQRPLHLNLGGTLADRSRAPFSLLGLAARPARLWSETSETCPGGFRLCGKMPMAMCRLASLTSGTAAPSVLKYTSPCRRSMIAPRWVSNDRLPSTRIPA